MRMLVLLGALSVAGVVATGIWFIINNITLKKGKRK